MGRRGRLEGSLTKMGRAPSRARARDASSPSRRTLCISNIVESIGPLARSEGAPRPPRRVCTCDCSPRSTNPSADFRRVDGDQSLVRAVARPPIRSSRRALSDDRTFRPEAATVHGRDRRGICPWGGRKDDRPFDRDRRRGRGRPRRLLGDRRGICPWGGRKDDRPFDRDRRRDRRRGHPWERGDTAPPRRLP